MALIKTGKIPVLLIHILLGESNKKEIISFTEPAMQRSGRKVVCAKQ